MCLGGFLCQLLVAGPSDVHETKTDEGEREDPSQRMDASQTKTRMKAKTKTKIPGSRIPAFQIRSHTKTDDREAKHGIAECTTEKAFSENWVLKTPPATQTKPHAFLEAIVRGERPERETNMRQA